MKDSIGQIEYASQPRRAGWFARLADELELEFWMLVVLVTAGPVVLGLFVLGLVMGGTGD